MDRYIDRGITAAEDDQAAAVVIVWTRVGGAHHRWTASSSHPRGEGSGDRLRLAGRRARGLGGAVHHVRGTRRCHGGGDDHRGCDAINGSGDNRDSDLRAKVINDSVAKIRGSLNCAAERRWAEDAVRNGTSAPRHRRPRPRVVDYVEPKLDDLLGTSTARA